ncbi:MAG: hypothetical protein HZA14_00320 [Nitrospirae bacterium]|nr:hypothetical protein [Nitrospirota bacterium]
MIRTDLDKKIKAVIILFAWIAGLILYPSSAKSGPYLNSAHGSASYGVNRTSLSSIGYSKGHCAHCHEQHASIEGSEPEPMGGIPDNYSLFYTNYTNQTDSFCITCHTDVSSYQTGGLTNRSYSYRAGGWTSDTLNDTKEAFSFTSPGTSHNLYDIKTFITGRWGYTADSNPCAACHNPHSAQRDPHTSGSRGWPVSRPGQHSKDNNAWGLWGDAASEKMNNYTLSYQAPYIYNSTTTYEPDGSSTTDGSNLADYVTFCTDCHNNTNIISSTLLGRNLKTIDWNNEKHGKGNADESLCGDNPYPSGTSGLGKVLACTDCHEPHGSQNAFLARQEVNGGILGGNIGSFSTTDWHYICDRCHKDDNEINGSCQTDHYYITHHSNEGCNTDRPYNPNMCNTCHSGGGGMANCTNTNNKLICTNCHYHGSSVTNADYSPTTRRTF